MDNLKKINDRLGYFQLNLSHQFNNKPYNGLSTVFSTICIRVCPIFHLSWEKDGIYLIIVCVSFLAGMQNSYERLFQNVEAFFWESVMNQKFYPIPPSPLCVKTKQNLQNKGKMAKTAKEQYFESECGGKYPFTSWNIQQGGQWSPNLGELAGGIV